MKTIYVDINDTEDLMLLSYEEAVSLPLPSWNNNDVFLSELKELIKKHNVDTDLFFTSINVDVYAPESYNNNVIHDTNVQDVMSEVFTDNDTNHEANIE